MMKYLTIAVYVVAVYTVIFLCIPAVNALDIDRCSILGFSGETYVLTTNVSTEENTCFTINAPNITLDCKEFSITINNIVKSSHNSGIYSNQPNTVIKNCDKSIQNQDQTEQSQNKTALFDIIADIVTEPKKPGEDLIAKVSLVNFGGSDTIDAHLTYTVMDDNGVAKNRVAIVQYTKIVSVKTQTEFLEHINTTGMSNGKYILKIELTYAGQTFPASTEKVFYVGLITGLFGKTSIKTFILPIITLALLIGVYRKSVMNKVRENSENTNSSDNSTRNHDDTRDHRDNT